MAVHLSSMAHHLFPLLKSKEAEFYSKLEKAFAFLLQFVLETALVAQLYFGKMTVSELSQEHLRNHHHPHILPSKSHQASFASTAGDSSFT
jgi:hypothetical protein